MDRKIGPTCRRIILSHADGGNTKKLQHQTIIFLLFFLVVGDYHEDIWKVGHLASVTTAGSPNKKTKSTPARFAPLCSLPYATLGSAPACGVRLLVLPDATRGCPLLVSVCGCPLRVSARGCLCVPVAWFPALPGAQTSVSHGARLPALPGSVRSHYIPALSCSHRRPAAYKLRWATGFGELHMLTSLHSPSSL
jgi:hypothetical protein